MLKIIGCTILLLMLSPLFSNLLAVYPYWVKLNNNEPVHKDLPSPVSQKVKDYTNARNALTCEMSQSCLSFYVGYLEDKEPYIAEDAFRYVSTLSFEVVRDNYDTFPLAKLRRYVVERKLNPEHRDFYCLVLGLKKHHADRNLILEVMDDFLSNPNLHNSRMVGVLSGYAINGSNFAEPMFLKALKFNSKASAVEQHQLDVIEALEFLKENMPGVVDKWSANVLRAALQKGSPLQDRALELAHRWNDVSQSHLLLPLMKKGNTSERFRRYAMNYCQAVKDEPCRLAMVWIKDNDPAAYSSSQSQEDSESSSGK